MNIFYLHHDPLICAKMHCDKHVVKMILEYSQILSTAHHECDGVPSVDCYKATHKNHPSTVWARENFFNYDWLHALLSHLSKEYTHRYGKIHATERKGIIRNLLKSESLNLRTVLGKKSDSEKLHSIMQNLSKNRTKTSKRG